MKPLTAREWLEQERQSMLPHADFAAEILADLDELDAFIERDDELRDRVDRATGDQLSDNDQIVEAFAFRNAVLIALTDAGVIDDECTSDQAAGLLRMFLP